MADENYLPGQDMCILQGYNACAGTVWQHTEHMRKWHSADTVRSASAVLFSNS